MFYQFPNNDEFLFNINNANEQSDELKQYCKSENIMLTSLISANNPKVTLKFRMELATCHLLQRIYNWLSVVINRLTVDMEQNGKVRKQLS